MKSRYNFSFAYCVKLREKHLSLFFAKCRAGSLFNTHLSFIQTVQRTLLSYVQEQYSRDVP